MDETSLSTVHKPPKVISQRGKHQVGAITSGERGLTTTGICAMNAAGEFIPPMLIFKRSRLNDALKKGAPPNTEFGCSKNGWITSELFVQWLQHFIKYGHSTHTKNLEAIQLARDNELLGKAYPRSVRMDIALNGFKATGLWPCDRKVIKEEDFVASLNISDPSNQEVGDQSDSTMTPSILRSPIPVVSPPKYSSQLLPKITTPPLSPRVSTPPIIKPRF
nr:uncharacterized protein LOC113400706 [Vanessa tameamea]